VAFVPQDDIMPIELSVESNVKFSASYRLDRGSDVNEATARVLSALELSGVRHQQVGDAERRGISGGERKRVNIGMELVANPSVLLLDEPTSGLDASAAIKVMRLLKRVARHGTAVVAVVHQPRREIFELFDDVLLLAKGGQVAYMGPRKGCLPFFAAHFASLPMENQNPADFLLDMVTDSRPEQLERFSSVWRAHAKAARPSISLRAKEAVKRRYRRRPWGVWQMVLCMQRCFVQWAVNYPSELLYAVLFFLMGMLVGLLFQDVEVDELPQPNFLLAFVLGLASMHYSLRLFGQRPGRLLARGVVGPQPHCLLLRQDDLCALAQRLSAAADAARLLLVLGAARLVRRLLLGGDVHALVLLGLRLLSSRCSGRRSARRWSRW
jgi:ABC-type multidrug transport system ATPase subunit